MRVAQSTKMRLVYDASATASPDGPLLNDCLHAGEILVTARSFAITGDIQKAFPQICLKECE